MLGRVFPQAIMFHLTSSWNKGIIRIMSEDVTKPATNLRGGGGILHAGVAGKQRIVLAGLFW